LFETALLQWENKPKDHRHHHTGVSFQSYADFVLGMKSVIFGHHIKLDMSVTMFLLAYA
jgi:hypothetical protein